LFCDSNVHYRSVSGGNTGEVLRRADNCRLTYRKLFFGKYRVTFWVGKTAFDIGKYTEDYVDDSAERQMEQPQRLAVYNNRAYWRFRDRFYWDNDFLSSDQIYALLVTRLQREQATIERAQAMVASGTAPKHNARGLIPDDVKQLVFMRDGGKCRTCGSGNELQFDHVIPVALGGGDSPDNLQVLCGPCNRSKGAGLVSAPAQPKSYMPPAGWYPDPDGAARQRYWDGGQWTEHLAE
jgi:hypothetical protein